MDKWLNKTISHYTVVEKLGAGGMGIVYKAEDTKLQRFVALKFLPPELTRNEEAKQRFILEARNASAIEHSNICTIHEINETEDGQLFIAMPCYEGQTLKSTIENRQLKIEEVVDIIIQIAKGLDHAHRKGIVHRDIKPANIMITEAGEVKILDFGLAKLAGQTNLTKSGTTLGTISYMSPEQAQGEEIDQRTDLWSLGVVLYEMLTGELPFKGEYDMAVIYLIINHTPKPLRDFRQDLENDFQKVIDNLIAKEPEGRYHKAEGALQDLQQLQQSSGAVPGMKRTFNKKRFGAIGIISGLILLLLAMVVIIPDLSELKKANSDVVASNRIAVLPFEINGSEEISYLSTGMMKLLSTNFDGAGDLKRVDPNAIQNYLEAAGEKLVDAEYARNIARHFDANLYVLGNIYETGDKLQFTASLYDVDQGRLHTVKMPSVDEANVFDYVDELTGKLLAAHPDIAIDRFQKIASLTTNSNAALKAYLKGEILAEKGQYTEAMRNFQLAIDEDSTFSLAYYRLSLNVVYTKDKEVNRREMIEQAVKYSEHLSKRDRDLINARYLQMNGEIRWSEQRLQLIVRSYPDDAEAWELLAETLGFYSGRMGRSYEEARTAALKAISLNPNKEIILGGLQLIEIKDENISALDSVSTKRIEVAPDGEFALTTRSLIAFIRDDKAAQKKVIQELPFIYSYLLFVTSGAVAKLTENYQAATEIAEMLLTPSQQPYWQSNGERMLAYINLRQGKFRAAENHLKSASEIRPGRQVLNDTYLCLTPLIPWNQGDLRQRKKIVNSLERSNMWRPIVIFGSIGLINAQLGDYDAASIYADSLEKYGASLVESDDFHKMRAKAMSFDFAHIIRAKVSFENSEFEKSLHEIQQINLGKWEDYGTPVGLIETHVYDRYLRVQVLRKLKRYDEAIQWLSSIGKDSVYEIFYRVPQHQLLAEIYEETGQPQKALENYIRITELWKDCDPELQPVVDAARERIKQLTEN